jgi:hypothetical protein
MVVVMTVLMVVVVMMTMLMVVMMAVLVGALAGRQGLTLAAAAIAHIRILPQMPASGPV